MLLLFISKFIKVFFSSLYLNLFINKNNIIFSVCRKSLVSCFITFFQISAINLWCSFNLHSENNVILVLQVTRCCVIYRQCRENCFQIAAVFKLHWLYRCNFLNQIVVLCTTYKSYWHILLSPYYWNVSCSMHSLYCIHTYTYLYIRIKYFKSQSS